MSGHIQPYFCAAQRNVSSYMSTASWTGKSHVYHQIHDVGYPLAFDGGPKTMASNFCSMNFN